RALKLISKIDKNQLTNYTASSVQFTHAVIAWDKGDQPLAHNLLDSCLTLAVPESIASPFVGLDESSRALILAHIDQGTPHEHFLTERLATSPSHVVSTLEPNRDLSRRETEILQYLATPMAEEIAECLFISPAIVRSHQRSIYRKLGVKRRRDAVRVGLQ
ncbi:MAG: helix-turn-helix transcriptional regulator, partial [Flaviflexus sp.]|uniref:helix-turn-helix transcriptional regulator n=1 Tax=Flaviflexus sp. TaxID=1969482 RepID=UPI003F8FB2C7